MTYEQLYSFLIPAKSLLRRTIEHVDSGAARRCVGCRLDMELALRTATQTLEQLEGIDEHFQIELGVSGVKKQHELMEDGPNTAKPEFGNES